MRKFENLVFDSGVLGIAHEKAPTAAVQYASKIRVGETQANNE